MSRDYPSSTEVKHIPSILLRMCCFLNILRTGLSLHVILSHEIQVSILKF